MAVQKVINIEDTVIKHNQIKKALKSFGVKEIFWAKDAESGIAEIEDAIAKGQPYDVLVSDMHFKYEGKDDLKAGEKTLHALRAKGIETPVIFCFLQNWLVEGAVAAVFYNERRYWEDDLKKALDKIR